MITDPILPDDIRYNPATTCFEALVTVHGAGPARVYACEVKGDISLDTATVISALQEEARRRYAGAHGLFSARQTAEPRPAHRPEQARPFGRWFPRLPFGTNLHAA